MIDFRYHLVSIIAVFLALAVGIVLGTTALNGPVLDSLRGNIDRLSSDKRALEGDVQDLRGDVRTADDFATSVGPGLVAGTLDDERVLLVVSPGTPSDLVDRLTPLLVAAGAEVTGQLRVLPALSDPASRQLVEDLVADVLPAGVDLPDGEPVERAAAELAAALGRQPGEDGIDGGEAQAVLSAFQEADLIQYTGESEELRRATAVVVLGAPAVEDPEEQELVEQAAVLSLAGAFDDTTGGVVVAGPSGSVDDDGLVRLLRDDSGLAGRVSSVDNADRGVGLVALVQALAEQMSGRVGQYGTGAGAAGALPSAGPAS
ncbi:MAG: hypothetical protein JWN08_3718 [Frankiales bacterium]|nr:hypothetical protein [Frankiales bacterium]